MPVRRAAKIPEAILHLQQELDQWRLLRLPGTYNRKRAEPVTVRYEVINGGRRFNTSDFEEFLEIEAESVAQASLDANRTLRVLERRSSHPAHRVRNPLSEMPDPRSDVTAS